jgi:hypothetical protein
MTVALPASGEPSAVDRATAQSLFDDARKLVDAGKFGEACPKFAESLRFDPGLGTMLRLADCYEKNGQIASAWAVFLDASENARKAGDAREKVAKERADALAPRVSKLSVRVAEPKTQGLVVKRDGEVIGPALFGTAAPVDPGKHAIEATAPGKKVWKGSVDVPSGGGSVSIDVPALSDDAGGAPVVVPPSSAKPAAPPPAEPAAPPKTGPKSNTAAYVVTGLGVVGTAVGVVLYLGAKSKHDDALSQCVQGATVTHCPDSARTQNDSAKTTGTIGAVVGGVGAAALVTGIIMLATGGSSSSSSAGLRVSPMALSQGGGLLLGGSL